MIELSMQLNTRSFVESNLGREGIISYLSYLLSYRILSYLMLITKLT